jgi:hypothetical protein
MQLSCDIERMNLPSMVTGIISTAAAEEEVFWAIARSGRRVKARRSVECILNEFAKGFLLAIGF